MYIHAINNHFDKPNCLSLCDVRGQDICLAIHAPSLGEEETTPGGGDTSGQVQRLGCGVEQIQQQQKEGPIECKYILTRSNLCTNRTVSEYIVVMMTKRDATSYGQTAVFMEMHCVKSIIESKNDIVGN